MVSASVNSNDDEWDLQDKIYGGEDDDDDEESNEQADAGLASALQTPQPLEISNPLPTPQGVPPRHSEESKHDTDSDLAQADGPFAQAKCPVFLQLHLSKTPLALLTVFSYLHGNVIYHRIALLNRKIRGLLIQSFFLN